MGWKSRAVVQSSSRQSSGREVFFLEVGWGEGGVGIVRGIFDEGKGGGFIGSKVIEQCGFDVLAESFEVSEGFYMCGECVP